MGAEFEALVAAKEEEIAAATEAIEMKTDKNGEMAVKIVNLKNDLDDTQESLGEDQKFLEELPVQLPQLSLVRPCSVPSLALIFFRCVFFQRFLHVFHLFESFSRLHISSLDSSSFQAVFKTFGPVKAFVKK